MATIGHGAYTTAVHTFFDGLVTGDLEKAVSVVADDADMESPWAGQVSGKQAIQDVLEPLLTDPKQRLSFAMIDISGDGNVTRMLVSIGRRFGEAPKRHQVSVFHAKGLCHHIRIERA